MLNAMIWALACFGVVAADIALSVVLFFRPWRRIGVHEFFDR